MQMQCRTANSHSWTEQAAPMYYMITLETGQKL